MIDYKLDSLNNQYLLSAEPEAENSLIKMLSIVRYDVGFFPNPLYAHIVKSREKCDLI